LLPIGTGGCWGWKGKTGFERGSNGEHKETHGPLPDFGLLTRKGRKVLIAFDSNVTSNPKVYQARQALAQTLMGWGAKVFFVELPQAEGVNGPDDWIALAGNAGMVALLGGAKPAPRRWRRPQFRSDRAGVDAAIRRALERAAVSVGMQINQRSPS
jgi:hypothetical protein